MEEGFETGLVGAAECLWLSPLLSLVGNDVMTWHPKVLYAWISLPPITAVLGISPSAFFR